ncbi:hypothetical protein CC1G_15260 [Coprinopsis cinerea okayama7|uniref:Uncharacterized protein n=1 Tax=Coprinopsis cinerea (strain Okayama-7 / 130 / ATCC MYA-4618 / FGSC 9003) TaxID=240176 RepID=D6RPV9_COPC7|nr:hypothetical protein CC1G_15260 [Coprinopsis cinerea okayama7\|eukprot:XP_002910352.1 hypothetical protein CC1G_15260 [Coprinopsis cinerea okayama7\
MILLEAIRVLLLLVADYNSRYGDGANGAQANWLEYSFGDAPAVDPARRW